ncbi:MAG: polysaccharide pyruvyl transferase family protein, partial [Planctomycetota bacterium]
MALRSLIVFTRFNAMVIAGGQWLHDLSLAKHAIICSMFGLARLSGTRTGVFCIGVGPLRRPVSQWLLRCGFGASSLLVTRDEASTALLHKAGRSQAITASDPALHLPTADVAPTADVLISPCAWASFENLYAQDSSEIEASLSEWRTLLLALQERGHSLAVLPTMNPEDEDFAARIIEDQAIEIIDTGPLTPSEVQGHIAKAKHLISMRLHPVIFATNCGVHFVSLNYAAKVRAFCEQAGLGERVVELGQTGWAQDVLARLDLPPIDDTKARAARAEQLLKVNAAYEALLGWLKIDEAPAPASEPEAERSEA